MWPLAFSTLNIRLISPQISSLTLKESIKAEAKRLGFALCGITLPEPGIAFERYSAWLEAGFNAEMAYMARPDAVAKRQKLELLLPDCRSVVCVALPYAPPEQTMPSLDNHRVWGSIAAYARFVDYHTVIRQKLEALGKFVAKVMDKPVGYYTAVDSSPVLEKGLAIQAGLGQVGKNTLLWNKTLGSWFFLGELFLDIDLEPDRPIQGDFCGDCDVCVNACPTGALRGNRTMNAGRCLSYLTIEHRGSFPLEYREAMGCHVFGCDICQLVCPKNESNLKADYSYPLSSVLDTHLDLIDALNFNEETFKACYKDTALHRAKYHGFRRNIVIALGNSGKLQALDALKAGLQTEENQDCRESMLWAINRLSKTTALLP